MSRFRKSRSTLEGRKEAFQRLVEMTTRVCGMDHRQLVDEYSRESAQPSLAFPETYSREQLVVMLLKAMAGKIVDAP